jgi:superfamily I DNA and RNA helicase
LISSAGRYQQSAKIISRIVELIVRESVSPGDIVVLIADALRKAEYCSILKSLPLPKPARWLEEGIRGENTILIDTIQRFKGLESPIVIIWGLDTLDLSKYQEVLYVGMSRAKSFLAIVGKSETCTAFNAAGAFGVLCNDR